ncbi:hypothetical protein BJ165DRAFT_1522381 [Panaeolus papilionaceus]|nr:hypothetical protein BJ165DRAFT_1522381 [Panaeolus papilionaceus]
MLRTINIKPASSQLLARHRHFHPSPWSNYTVTEKVTDAADKANKTVGKKLADAIDVGEKMTHKAKETLGAATEETAQKARSTEADVKTKAEKAMKTGETIKEDVKEDVKKSR